MCTTSSDCEENDEEGGEDEEDDKYQGNSPIRFLPSVSTENLHQELANCVSDGLSDKENIVRQIRRHVRYSAEQRVSPVSKQCYECVFRVRNQC